MSGFVSELYSPKLMAVAGPLANPGQGIAGFFCTATGTLNITRGTTAGGALIVQDFNVTVGTWYPMPFLFDGGAYANLGSGAAGTFAVGQ